MSDSFTADEWVKKGIEESDFKTAIDFFDAALFLDPNHQDALYHKGSIFLQNKHYQDAYKSFKTLSKVNKKHSEAWYSMGLACEMCTDIIPANKFYGKAVTLDPHHIDALNGLLRLNNKNSRKIYCFKRLAEAIPNNVKYWIELVKLNLIEDEINPANKNLSHAINHHPNNKKLTELQRVVDKKILEVKKETKARKKKIKASRLEAVVQSESDFKNEIIPEYYYKDWVPPAPVTVYCKIYGFSYNLYKYYRTRSSSEIQIRAIEDKLNSRKYNCYCCSSYLDEQCSYKNQYVHKNAICKHFEPNKEPKIREKTKNVDKKTLTKSNGKIKCPYCNRKLKSEKGIQEHLKAKHPNKVNKHL